ncbi:Sel1-like repeat [Sphingomonadaceae bacterium]
MKLEEIEREAFDAIEQDDFESAFRILTPIADERSAYALLTLGWMHDNALVVPEDKEVAQSYYIRAIDAGSLLACHRLGWLFLGQGNAQKARDVFLKGAEQGSISCMYEVGVMLLDGLGGGGDYRAGKNWLSIAADQGHFWSKRKLLGMQKQHENSYLRKLYINVRIFLLGIQGVVAHFRNPRSERHQ